MKYIIKSALIPKDGELLYQQKELQLLDWVWVVDEYQLETSCLDFVAQIIVHLHKFKVTATVIIEDCSFRPNDGATIGEVWTSKIEATKWTDEYDAWSYYLMSLNETGRCIGHRLQNVDRGCSVIGVYQDAEGKDIWK